MNKYFYSIENHNIVYLFSFFFSSVMQEDEKGKGKKDKKDKKGKKKDKKDKKGKKGKKGKGDDEVS